MRANTTHMKRIGLGVAVLALLGALVAWQLFPPAELPADGKAVTGIAREPEVLRYPVGAPELASLKTKAVEFVPLPLSEPLNARIVYDENVTARVSSPIAGRVTALRLQPGDMVRAGETLLQLDSPDLAVAVTDTDKAAADELRKKAALDRAQLLTEGGVLARKDLENAEADYQQAKAETQRARLRLHNLAPHGASGSGFALPAPLSGVIADRHVNPGMEVRPDLPDPLFVITNPSHLWAIVDLPERDLEKVAVGRPAEIEVDAYPGRHFPAKVERIAGIVDPASRRVQVRVAVTDPELRLKPEMYARVTLIADDNSKAVRVHNAALVTQGLYSYVFVETEPGVFHRRQVTLSVQDHDYSYIASGVSEGEKVVVGGALLLNAELLDAK